MSLLSRRDILALVPALAIGCYGKPNWNKVHLIGIDGMRADTISKENTPNLWALMQSGCYSLQSQTSDYTLSGPGWSSVLTGVWPHKHGVKDNTFAGDHYEEYPTLFKRLSSHHTSVAANWEPLAYNLVKDVDALWSSNYAESGDMYVSNDTNLVLRHSTTDLLFTYLSYVDETGHRYGFDPSVKEYMDAIKNADTTIGSFRKTLAARRNSKENWLTLVTTDHRGRMEGHGGTSPEEKTVFYIAHGPSTLKGELNPAPRHVDIVPTILKHMGVPIDPTWNLDGQPRGLR